MARRREKSRAAEALEWGLGAISGLAVLAIGGYLLHAGLKEPPEPALTVRAAAAPADGAIPFTVRNDGGGTATAVAVSMTLSRDGAPVGERRLVIDYVPGHSQVAGAFVLSPESEGLERRIVVEGYLEP